MANVPVQQAPAQAPIVAPGGLISREWLFWCKALQSATQTVAGNQTAIAQASTNVAALQASIAKLSTQTAGAAQLAGVNTFTGENRFVAPVAFVAAPVFLDPANTRLALGLGTAATMPASAFATPEDLADLQLFLKVSINGSVIASAATVFVNGTVIASL